MEHVSDEAYVLRTQELGEADLIVTLFAREHGCVRGVARSARRSRKRFGGGLDPLTEVRASWAEKEGRDLHRLDGLEPLRSHATIQHDPLGQATCALFCELTEQFSQEQQPDPTAYRLLGACLGALEEGAEPWLMIRYFQYWTLRIHGLLPSRSVCAQCGGGESIRWVSDSGELLCNACASAVGARRLNNHEVEFLVLAAERSPANLQCGGGRDRWTGLDRHLRRSLEQFTERPLKVMKYLRSLG